jgi:hypothetical protein
MINRLLFIAAFVCLLCLAGCLQRTNSNLPLQSANDGYTTKWKLVGTFGERAPALPADADPWQTHYPPGQFRKIAGLCATDKEVWVCDLRVSRVQVFDFAGNYLREVGQGNALDGLQPSNVELYAESQKSKLSNDWQLQHGQPWYGSEGKLFQASDVCVVPEGYWLADRARTANGRQVWRNAGYYLVTSQGVAKEYLNTSMLWPDYFATDGMVVACADGLGNSLQLAVPGTADWLTKSITPAAAFGRIAGVEAKLSGKMNFNLNMDIASGASSEAGKFDHLGGIALGYNKLVACDIGNRRLQIFDARPEPASRWGTLLRVIPAESPRIGKRFNLPIDLDISLAGLVFVLDGERREVALLNPRFERIGSFGLGELVDPLAIDLSDDGRDCFITDATLQKVFHYAATD